MKPKHWLFSVGAGGALLVACALPNRAIDTGPLQQRFQRAEPVAHMRAERAALAVRTADYRCALHELKRLCADRKISPDQRRTIRNLMTRVERTAGSVQISPASTQPAAHRISEVAAD
jgi:hypothetical protein